MLITFNKLFRRSSMFTMDKSQIMPKLFEKFWRYRNEDSIAGCSICVWHNGGKFHWMYWFEFNLCTQIVFHNLQGIPCDIHVINWASELHWTADSSICKAEFVHLCLQSWIPHYQWRNVNNTVASLSQLMSTKKNAGKIEEVASQPQ